MQLIQKKLSSMPVFIELNGKHKKFVIKSDLQKTTTEEQIVKLLREFIEKFSIGIIDFIGDDPSKPGATIMVPESKMWYFPITLENVAKKNEGLTFVKLPVTGTEKIMDPEWVNDFLNSD